MPLHVRGLQVRDLTPSLLYGIPRCAGAEQGRACAGLARLYSQA